MNKDLEKLFRRIEREYEKAKGLDFVRKPLAYALYRVWRDVDRKERERDKDRD